MNRQNTLKEISEVIKSNNNIVVLSHYNPDPDAYGSSCGLALALKALGKKICLLNESGLIERLAWIPSSKEIVAEYPAGNWDLVITCDCGDSKRVGDRLKDIISSKPVVINIDHHASNDFFGHFNYVDPKASSTSEIIASLIEVLGVNLNADIATCLYAGLSGDTGSFRYSSTTVACFALAQKLVSAGASPTFVAESIYAKNSLAALKLHSAAIANLKLLTGAKISWVAVTLDMFKQTGAEKEDADVVVDIIRDIQGVDIAVLLKQDFGFWRVSLRARSSKVDLSKVASFFGGGGHKAAAGFRWRNKLEELEPLLLQQLNAQLANE